MSASPTSNGVDRNMSATNKETSTISQQAKRRRKKNKRKKSQTGFHPVLVEQQRGMKRKLDELLENETECVEHGDVSDSVSEQSNHMQFKRSRITPSTLGNADKVALPFTDCLEVDSGFSSESSPPTSGRSSPFLGMDHSKFVAMDCEMVGTGPGGKCSEVARCSIVDYYGNVLYDKYILPQRPVTDYRTRWSGIRKYHLQQAVPFVDAQKEIVDILTGKIIVGHAIFNDFRVLNISVPPQMIRDTGSSKLLRGLYNGFTRCGISLKKLSETLLNRTIQSSRNGHCSVEDARATLDLYKLVEDQWEKNILFKNSNMDHTSNPNSNLEHYMQDQYWPDSIMDCSP
ncbi:apoptosis-enhancing nuclease [Garra rufa]|uniref:apoptosis-enhancing nuclease n=1 Tax=Garra rufa TaxID=137080 RepID=UPI003CCEDEAA